MKSDPRSSVRRKPAGGVGSVKLAAVSNVAAAAFDDEGAVCTLCDFADATQVMECRILEDESAFVERLTADSGVFAVRHTLSVVADRNLAEAWLGAPFLEESRCGGFVAQVTLNDGRRLLAGYSKRFGGEQPLRIRSIEVASGRRPAERPTVTLVLENLDTTFAARLESE